MMTRKGDRIPLTIADWDQTEGSATIVFMKGEMTMVLAMVKAGDYLNVFVGPPGLPAEGVDIRVINLLVLPALSLGRSLISNSASSASATFLTVDKDGSELPLSSLAILSCFVFNSRANSS